MVKNTGEGDGPHLIYKLKNEPISYTLKWAKVTYAKSHSGYNKCDCCIAEVSSIMQSTLKFYSPIYSLKFLAFYFVLYIFKIVF